MPGQLILGQANAEDEAQRTKAASQGTVGLRVGGPAHFFSETQPPCPLEDLFPVGALGAPRTSR